MTFLIRYLTFGITTFLFMWCFLKEAIPQKVFSSVFVTSSVNGQIIVCIHCINMFPVIFCCWDENYYAFWEILYSSGWNSTTPLLNIYYFQCDVKKLFIYKFMRILMWGAVVQKHIGIFLKSRRAEKRKKGTHSYIS